MSKKILDVPYYSQYIDIKDEEWQSRSCGIVCLKMVIDFYNKNKNSLDDFIKKGVSKNGFGPSGWIHDVLVQIAKDYGFTADRKEYRSEDKEEESKMLEQAIEEKVKSLENNQPVIVSVIRNFIEKNKFHLVVLTGFEMEENKLKGFYYHDPDSLKNWEKKHKFVPIETFKKHWRKLSIYVKI